MKPSKKSPSPPEEQLRISGIKAQINLIEHDLRSLYTNIGKKYVNYIIDSGKTPEIDLDDVIDYINTKTAQKEELQNKILELLLN